MEKNKMTVLLIEPEARPKVVTMETGLKPLQEAVGGYIEAVYPFDDPVALIVNEEGKLDGLPLNRALRHKNGEVCSIRISTIGWPTRMIRQRSLPNGQHFSIPLTAR